MLVQFNHALPQYNGYTLLLSPKCWLYPKDTTMCIYSKSLTVCIQLLTLLPMFLSYNKCIEYFKDADLKLEIQMWAPNCTKRHNHISLEAGLQDNLFCCNSEDRPGLCCSHEAIEANHPMNDYLVPHYFILWNKKIKD